MEMISNTFNDLIPFFKAVFPTILACAFFHCFLRISLRLLRGDSFLYREHNEPKYVNKKPVKLDKKYYPKKYDIPEKQKDFIQLN